MSKEVKIGNIKIGGGNPIAIQSMANVDPHDEKALADQVMRLSLSRGYVVRYPDYERLYTSY